MRALNSYRRAPTGGFTLLEILIAVLVLSIGVLGVAGLQVAGLRSNQTSLQGGQAVALSYEIADRMRANPVAARAGAYVLAIGTPARPPDADCRTASCSPAQLAARDLYEWQLRVAEALPGSTAQIDCPSPCDGSALQTITLFWDQTRTGATGTECRDDPAQALNPREQLSCIRIGVQP